MPPAPLVATSSFVGSFHHGHDASANRRRKASPGGDDGSQFGVQSPESAKQNAKTFGVGFTTFYFIAS